MQRVICIFIITECVDRRSMRARIEMQMPLSDIPRRIIDRIQRKHVRSILEIRLKHPMQKSIYTVLGFLSQCSRTQKMKTDIAFAIRKWVIICLSNVRTLHLITDTMKFRNLMYIPFQILKCSQLNL